MDLMITCPKCGKKIDVSEQMTKLLDQRMAEERPEIVKQERKKAEAEYQERTRKAVENAENKAREEEKTKHEAERKKLQGQLASSKEEIEDLKKQQDKKVEALARKQAKQEVEKVKTGVEKSYRDTITQKDLRNKELTDKLTKTENKLQEVQAQLNQGSPQAQGILAEKDLLLFLRKSLPADRCKVEKRGQGKKGTDVIVYAVRNDRRVGALVIDDKWANDWGRDWPEKVWNDMQMHEANFAYIAAKPSALPEEIKIAGFGLAPCRRTGVRVWVIDRSNPHLILGIILDTVDKILMLAQIEEVYGATSRDMKQFQAYLSKEYEIDLREKAKHMSTAVKALNDLHKKVNSEYERALDALKGYWFTEERVHKKITASFGKETVRLLPDVAFNAGG